MEVDATAKAKAYFNGKNIAFTVNKDTDRLTAKADPASPARFPSARTWLDLLR
jgi:hypothetical protein